MTEVVTNAGTAAGPSALVAGSWGSRPADGGKAVWFELSTATGPGH
ncbi:hypothetical protein ACFW1M_28585 [Streptomyces inhibens]